MRCSSYCTAEVYQITNNLNEFEKLGYDVQIIDKVVSLTSKKPDDSEPINIFLFPFGCNIIWGASESEELEILEKFKFIELKKLNEVHSEFINYQYNPENDRSFIDEEKNIIFLGDKSTIIKLSISHALAQSIKLNELEGSIIKLLENTEPIQKELAATGRVSLSKSEISKQIGALFNARYSINLHSDILDTPEFFWRRPSFEPIYLMTVEFLDIRIRQGILNNHLDLIHELYSMLSSDLNHKSTTRLEVIIVLLITIEVALALHKENFLDNILGIFY